MSQSRELQVHITQMEEIRTILNAMKNLAFMEIHKLGRFQLMQGQAVANIERAAMDFLTFYPGLPLNETNAQRICILLSAERGFCGDFNESLIDAVTDGNLFRHYRHRQSARRQTHRQFRRRAGVN